MHVVNSAASRSKDNGHIHALGASSHADLADSREDKVQIQTFAYQSEKQVGGYPPRPLHTETKMLSVRGGTNPTMSVSIARHCT